MAAQLAEVPAGPVVLPEGWTWWIADRSDGRDPKVRSVVPAGEIPVGATVLRKGLRRWLSEAESAALIADAVDAWNTPRGVALIEALPDELHPDLMSRLG